MISKWERIVYWVKVNIGCVKLVYSTVIAAMSVWWMWNLPFQVIQIFFSLLLFKYFALSVGGTTSLYGQNVIVFIISGLMVNTYLDTALNEWYQHLSSLYRGKFATGGTMLSTRDYLYLAGVSPLTYLFAKTSWSFIMDTTLFLSYFLLGVSIFGLHIPPNIDILSILVLLVLGIVACSGLGLISASMYWIAGAYRGVEPIRFFVRLLVPLVAGIYVPREILPRELILIGDLMPHTYVVDGVRRVLFKGASLTTLTWNITVLSIQALVLIPLGIIMLKYSLELERARGTIY